MQCLFYILFILCTTASGTNDGLSAPLRFRIAFFNKPVSFDLRTHTHRITQFISQKEENSSFLPGLIGMHPKVNISGSVAVSLANWRQEAIVFLNESIALFLKSIYCLFAYENLPSGEMNTSLCTKVLRQLGGPLGQTLCGAKISCFIGVKKIR